MRSRLGLLSSDARLCAAGRGIAFLASSAKHRRDGGPSSLELTESVRTAAWGAISCQLQRLRARLQHKGDGGVVAHLHGHQLNTAGNHICGREGLVNERIVDSAQTRREAGTTSHGAKASSSKRAPPQSFVAVSRLCFLIPAGVRHGVRCRSTETIHKLGRGVLEPLHSLGSEAHAQHAPRRTGTSITSYLDFPRIVAEARVALGVDGRVDVVGRCHHVQVANQHHMLSLGHFTAH